MIAVEAAHEISARDVVTAKAVEVQLRGAVQVVRRLRPHLVEVDLHSGVEGFDRSPGVRGDVGVPEAVDVDEIELREPRRMGGGGSGASVVIEEERPYEFGFFCYDSATTWIYTLSLHDALPSSSISGVAS